MRNKEYQSTVDWLFKQFPAFQIIGQSAYKPTLENIQKLCDLIGNPEKKLRYVHIAGTNGKGSTASILASILTESNQVTALFTSPHLLDFRERIRVNGKKISEDEVVQFVHKIKSLQLDFKPSFFEISFAMALHHFEQKKCTICVIETGLGGRLDATNIIQPLLSIITNISLDHQSILGHSIAEIAYEKAGIIKNNIPVILGNSKKQEVVEVVVEKANRTKSDLFFADKIVLEKDIENFKLSLLGNYQTENLKTVIASMNILKNHFPDIEKNVQKGLDHLTENTGFYGRMQVISNHPLVIYDVSHNLEGIQKTIETIRQIDTQGKLHLLYGASNDKDISEIIKLFPNKNLHFTSFSSERSFNSQQLTEISLASKMNALVHDNPRNAIKFIKENASSNDVILVLGSFFLISDLLKD